MQTYTKHELLKIAKRYNNSKRSYLLVNPLQAKHMPVSPTKSLEMMKTLGCGLQEKYPNTKLIIGFAETATAIGASVASCFDDCTYIHTTRENIESVSKWIYFSEEHSHATEQKLCADSLDDIIGSTETIIFVDDELSTGKTLINIVEKMRSYYPQAKDKKVVIASIINRVSNENLEKLMSFNIVCEQLLKLENIDYSTWTDKYVVNEPQSLKSKETVDIIRYINNCEELANPRLGVNCIDYLRACKQLAKKIVTEISTTSLQEKKILVLGTEECMYPSLVLGQYIEETFPTSEVFSHSTTRSPIAISSDDNYPIYLGYHTHSFYNSTRETFIYNVQEYDTVIIVTDSKNIPMNAVTDISRIFSGKCNEMYIVKGL